MTLFFLFLLKFRVKLNLVQLLIFTTLYFYDEHYWQSTMRQK